MKHTLQITISNVELMSHQAREQKYMLETYPGAPATKDALLILIESYNNLGSFNLALDNASTGVTNYSNYSYKVNQNGKVLMMIKISKKKKR